ncbi:MAG: c-type cytochrome [Bacteroidetes bacterium]|nr:c-type cytochrome [Bacteroidota bacterium]
MTKTSAFLYSVAGVLSLAGLSFISVQQENHAPVVKINSPANNSTLAPGGQVSYQVSVSDKEDGDSRFDEINTKEVLLELKYVKPGVKAPASNGAVPDDPAGLAVIRSSNCLNCHNFNSKSLGPSFSEISKKYPLNKITTDTLINRIKNGSSGIWGFKEKMPSHPELSPAQIAATVQWIMKNAGNPDVNYYNGLTGIIRLPENRKGTYILTASYTDHGIKNTAAKHLKGQDVVLLSVK